MSGICGWFGGPAVTGESSRLQLMAQALGRADPVAPPITCAASVPLAAAGSPSRSRLYEFDDAVLAVDGRPFSDDEMHGDAFARRTIGALRSGGAEALARVNGDFALAFHDRKNGEGLLAIDRFGMRALMYAERNGELVFGSTLDALAPADPERRLDEQALYDYLYFHVVPGPRTVFRNTHRLMPGQALEWKAGRRLAPRAWWSMRFVEDRRAPLPELKSAFLDAVHRSVASASNGSRCGAFLSGGTDSSTVSGMLGRVTQEPAPTFSIGFEAAGYDEMEYARIAARHFQTQHHEYYVTASDVIDAVPRIADAYDQPFGNSSAVPAYYCARLAGQHGISHLLAGDGGDELFGGNERYAKQQLFGYYAKVPAPLRSLLIEPLLLGPDIAARIPLVRKGRRYVEQAKVPMPARYETGNLIDHIGRESIFEAGFLAVIDADHPHRLMREAHAPFADRSLINQMLAIDFRFVLADGDLPKVTRMCELAGVDVSFPLLDARVLDFSAELAPELKLRGQRLRWFFKEALREFLPHEIIVKKKHGFGLPIGHWLATHKPLFELAHTSLSRLKTRGIVKPAFVDRLGGSLLHEHPKYFGTLVWVLMMLGLWLESRRL